MPIAPSGYYAFKSRPVSARALRDAELVVEIERVFHDRNKGRGICGARKVWRLLAREGIEVGRGRVERLMRAQGLRGVRRDRQFVTTRPDPGTQRPRITCSGTSTPIGPTPCGWSISRMCRRGRGWRSPRSSLTCSPGGSWAGAPRQGLPDTASLTPTGWCCSDPLNLPSTPPSATPNASPTPARSPRSAPSGTPSTTRWPRP